MTDPTTTAQATVLTEERVRKMLGATGFIDPPDAAKDMRDLCCAYLALTEQVRVLRPVVEWYADEANYNDHHQLGVTAEFSAGKGLVQVVWIPDDGKRARRALAALEGQPQ